MCTVKSTQEIVYSLGWEDMGVVVTLDEWTAVVGLADNTGLALTEDGDVKVVLSMMDRLSEISNIVNVSCKFLVLLTALTRHFNLCQV